MGQTAIVPAGPSAKAKPKAKGAPLSSVGDIFGSNFDAFLNRSLKFSEIIKLITGLIECGAAYETMGSVYFRVGTDEDYGKLSHRTLDEMLQGTRFEPEPGKESPPDFALWKSSKSDEPSWESPWGTGRPGWHIECSAMAMHHLGATIDIHGGGLDLVFPHHENEIAQSETFSGKPFARFFLHNGMLRISGEDMHKSVGNIVRIKELAERFSSDAIRLWMLTTHYRSPLSYDVGAIAAQERAARRLRAAATDAIPGDSTLKTRIVHPKPFEERFLAAMNDDLNTPQAIAALFDLVRAINKGRSGGHSVEGAQRILRKLVGVLGLTLEHPVSKASDLSAEKIELLIDQRADLRRERRFGEADRVRAFLHAQGITLEDSPSGTTWQRN